LRCPALALLLFLLAVAVAIILAATIIPIASYESPYITIPLIAIPTLRIVRSNAELASNASSPDNIRLRIIDTVFNQDGLRFYPTLAQLVTLLAL
jgi:hypothetical protein